MNTLGIIFANIYDSSLGELTNKRTMASLPFGGRYRQIDFALSNMSNSGISHIGIITKYNYQSLVNHIGSGQEWDLEMQEEGLDYLTPFAMGHNGNYRGKLEAVDSARVFLELAKEEYVILVDSGVLCAIDFRKVMEAHIACGCDVTVVTKEGIANGTKQLDLAVISDDETREVKDIAIDYCADAGYHAAMGIYVLRRDLLINASREAVARSRYHFERDFVLRAFKKGEIRVNDYRFDGVALFNESTAEYYHNNLAILDADIRHGLFNTGLTIYTRTRSEVPAYIGHDARIDESIIGDGGVIHGAVEHSVLFRGVHMARGAVVRDSLLMEDVVVGEGAQLECVILDKEVRVRPGARLIGTKEHPVVVKKGEII